MLPGHIAGFYDYDECHIDLMRLAGMCGIQFIQAAASRIDSKVRKFHLSSSKRQPLHAHFGSCN